ncbi:MAG: hypothetical protein GKR89_36045 [Candidatus Latescibacteria bacterium]|nr:hypothetical protein [Candidatus Latescibacterota bacterium]
MDMVQQFHRTFQGYSQSAPTAQVPSQISAGRIAIFAEELAEYQAAVAAGDIVEVADALTDMLYVLLGTFITHGLQDKAVKLFAEVHRSNMSKLDKNGRPLYREDGKILKSELFSAPDLAAIINRP